MARKDLSKDPLVAFFRELSKVKDNQRSLVIVTHGFIELLVNTLIAEHCKHGKKKIASNKRDYPQAVKLVLLSELNVIDNRLYGILDWFRKLRNKAAHEPFFALTPGDLDFAKKSMDRFLPSENIPEIKDLNSFCQLLVGTIWNNNLDLFVPIFTPTLVEKNN
jgi:hypothetical protein